MLRGDRAAAIQWYSKARATGISSSPRCADETAHQVTRRPRRFIFARALAGRVTFHTGALLLFVSARTESEQPSPNLWMNLIE